MNMKSNINFLLRHWIMLVLLLITIFAFALRIYKLDEVPPSISWDEATNGYNAYTIANWGRDEYGTLFPPYFRSFGDDKHPVHIYVTAPFVKVFGLSEFSTRLPAAVFGTLSVLLMYFLAQVLFKSRLAGLVASFFLAVSPYHLHFSRTNHEAGFALFFFLSGLVLFFRSLKKGSYLPFSVLSFILSFLAYHPAKVVVPVIILLLFILWWKNLIKNISGLLISGVLVFFLAVLVYLNPQLLGIARVSQTSLNNSAIEKTKLFQLTQNPVLGRLNLVAEQYSWHFYPQYLFISGDKNARLSAQGAGEFYKIDAILLILGVVYLVFKRSKASILVLVWALIAPLPSSLVAEAPHAARAMFMMGSYHLISALGLYFLLNLVRKKAFKIIILIITVIILLLSLQNFLNYYFGEYVKRYAIEWQYGMKQIVEYVKDHEEYGQVFMTDVRSQPYIFFLYYLRPPLQDYLSSVIYNNSESNRSYNTVSIFGRYYFGGWDPVESLPNPGVLYVLTPSQYDGLRYRLAFEVKRVIYYPNGTVAYYLVSSN